MIKRKLLTCALLLAFLVPAARLQAQEEGSPTGTEGTPTEEEIVEEVEESEEGEELQPPGPAPGFDASMASFDSTDILYSSEATRLIKQCLLKWTHEIPLQISLIVRISPTGKAQSISIKEPVTANSTFCIQKGLESIPFVPAPQAYSVAARYSFKPSDFTEKEEKVETVKVSPEGEKLAGKDPARTRLIYLQNAYTNGKGIFNFTTIWGGNIKLSYGITDNIDISFNTTLPVMQWGLGVSPKFSFRLHEKVYYAIKADIGIAFPYFLDIDTGGLHSLGFLYGGAPVILTAGTQDYYFNFSVHLLGMSIAFFGFDEDDEWDNNNDTETIFVILPNIGGSIRIVKKVKFNLSLWTVITTEDGLRDWVNGKIWGVMYGFRIFAGQFFGDINFVMPIFDGFWEIQKYIPLGYPMIAFGFNHDFKK